MHNSLEESKLVLSNKLCLYCLHMDLLSECFGYEIRVYIWLKADCYFDHAHLISVSDEIVNMA